MNGKRRGKSGTRLTPHASLTHTVRLLVRVILALTSASLSLRRVLRSLPFHSFRRSTSFLISLALFSHLFTLPPYASRLARFLSVPFTILETTGVKVEVRRK